MNAPPPPDNSDEFLSLPALIKVLEAGKLDKECSVQLMTIHNYLRDQNMQERDGKASLTLTINFDLKRGLADVVGHVKAKIPQPPRLRTPLYVTARGFSDQLPGQARLPFAVESGTVGVPPSWGNP